MSILPPEGEPWSRRMMELSAAERDRYGPEFERDEKRPPVPACVGVTD